MNPTLYRLTLKDVMAFPLFRDMNAIAGAEGLSRPVSCCGILDYQFSPTMKSKYFYSAFTEGMLVFTTFLYAADGEYLILDAIRRMDALGVAGLAINNVFRIKIPDSVLRFANANKFPIFIMEDNPENSFSNLVRSLYEIVGMYSDADGRQRIVEELMNQCLDENTLVKLAYKLYPSMGKDYRIDFYSPGCEVSDIVWLEIENAVRDASRPYKGCCRYRGGMLVFHTLDPSNWASVVDNADEISVRIREMLPLCAVGISWIHHKPDGFKDAIEEAIQAAGRLSGPGTMRYAHLGTYRILANAPNDYRMKSFSNDILRPIFDYDASENGRLIQTLFGLIDSGRNLHKLSEALGQHENTVRQRLARIAALTGLDYRNIDEYEQLSLAVKIHHSIEGSLRMPTN